MSMTVDVQVDRDTVDRAAEVFRLLGNPTATGLFLTLDAGGEKNVGVLADRLGKPITEVSRCLVRLSLAGMVAARRVGTYRYYHATDLGQRLARFVREMGP